MLTIFLVTLLTMSRQAEAIKSNEAVLVVIQKLHTITALTVERDERNASITKAIEPIGTPSELRQIALVSLGMMSGLAEHESSDDVYWTAFWVAAKTLASNQDDESVRALELLADRAQLDGGELVAMRELLVEQRRRRTLTKE